MYAYERLITGKNLCHNSMQKLCFSKTDLTDTIMLNI